MLNKLFVNLMVLTGVGRYFVSDGARLSPSPRSRCIVRNSTYSISRHLIFIASGLAKMTDSGHQRSRSRSRSPPRERHHHHSSRRSPSPWSRSRSASPRRSYSRSRRHDDSRSSSPRRSHIRDEEEEVVTDTFIRAVAAEIKGHGSKYEQSLRERERNNPKFAFLLKKDVSSSGNII